MPDLKTKRYSVRTKINFLACGVFGALLSVACVYTEDAKLPKESTDYYGVKIYEPENQVAYRANCKISRFGIAPWLPPGNPKDSNWESATTEALKLMQIPGELIPVAIAKLKVGVPDDTIGMSNTNGIATNDGKVFSSTFITSFKYNNKYSICSNSHTNFVNNDRREFAKLYKVSSGDKVYYIGEFLACGNISRFYPDSNPSGIKLTSNEIPEPGTDKLLLAAAIGLLIIKAKSYV